MTAVPDVLASTAGLYEDASRTTWRLGGPRVIDALQGLLTNDVRAANVGQVIPCFALDAKGHPIADVRVWKLPDDAGRVLLDIPVSGATALREHFGRYLPPRFASVDPVPGSTIFRILGPAADDAVRAVLGGSEDLPGPDRFVLLATSAEVADPRAPSGGTALLARRPAHDGGGWDLLALLDPDDGLRTRLAEAVESTDGRRIERGAWDAWRVERGIPEYGRDYGIENLPQETGLVERAVSFDKGCYTGQEVVARIHYRGKVNRRLVGLRGTDLRSLDDGAELFLEARSVGHVTTRAISARLGPIALGMVRREVEPGARLAPSPAAVPGIEIVQLPFTFT